MQSKPGLKPPALMEVKVSAYSIDGAKLAAIKFAAKGSYAQRKSLAMWDLEVEEINGGA